MLTVEHEETFRITMNTLASCMEPIMPYLQDNSVFEVYANTDGKIWTDGYKGRKFTGLIMPAAQCKQIIVNVTSLTGQVVGSEKPFVDAEIPANRYFDKCRFQGNLPDIVAAPTFNIRKHPKIIFTLDNYVEQEILSVNQYKVIIRGIHDKKNIVAAGGTKSGKTTLLNAILSEMSKLNDRIILIEYTPELQCTAEDYVALRTTPSMTMADLLRNTLRMTPDRIVVGEVRGGEALALLEAWSTGHGGGCSTVHSNSAKDTLIRLENMISRVSLNPQQATIAQAVDYIVYLKYAGLRRRVEDIIQIVDFDPLTKQYVLEKVA